jgi:hypothetical protein
VGSLRIKEKQLLEKINAKSTDDDSLICLIEAVSVLNAINQKLDKLKSIEKRLNELETISTQQVVYTGASVSAPNVKTEEKVEAFIPTLNTDDMSVKGEGVKTSKKKRNLSGAAKNLKNVKKDSDNG